MEVSKESTRSLTIGGFKQKKRRGESSRLGNKKTGREKGC